MFADFAVEVGSLEIAWRGRSRKAVQSVVAVGCLARFAVVGGGVGVEIE